MSPSTWEVCWHLRYFSLLIPDTLLFFILIWVSDLYQFSSPWTNSFTVSCRAGLSITSPFFLLRKYFSELRVVGWWVSFLSPKYFTSFSSWLLVRFLMFLLYREGFFSLWLLRRLLFDFLKFDHGIHVFVIGLPQLHGSVGCGPTLI